jgi:nonribosomal peptide synthetase CepB
MGWLAERAGPVTRFCMSMLVAVPAELEMEQLVAALQAVTDHHGMLRSRLVCPPRGPWRLEVPPAGTVPAGPWARRAEAAGLDERALAAVVAREARAAAGRLDPQAGVMVQVVWLDAGPVVAGRLLLVIHHLVVDGVSWRILIPDLAVAWQAVAAGQQPVLAPTGMSFRQWARLLATRAHDPAVTAELSAWTAVLEGGDSPLASRPLDPARDTAAATAQVSVRVPTGLSTALLTSVPAAFHGGVNDVLLAGLTVAVTAWRQRRGGEPGPVLVDVESHGREQDAAEVDLSRTVGWFTSIYPVRLDTRTCGLAEVTAGGPAAGQAVRRVKEQMRAIPGAGLGYGLLRYLNLATGPGLAALPAPQIGFNYMGRFMAGRPAWEREDWRRAGDGLGGRDAGMLPRHVLEAGGVTRDLPGGPRLILTLSCPRELISEEAVRELGDDWLAALHGIATHATQPGADGHTPSDFPLLTLTQDEVEEFEDLATEIARGTK